MVQKDSINNKLLIICGPTASGKSSLAIECAKLLNTEIISADSMNVYKGFDIGSAKPSTCEMQGIKHHLIDVVNEKDTFSVGDYKELAEPIILDLLSKGKVPIVCGGTGFYINSLLFDLSYGNAKGNIEVRDFYMQMAKTEGNLAVYNVLKEKDPITAEKLHFNDVKRVVRALEICASGIKKSDIMDELIPKYDYRAYTINFSREVLYDRINKRVDLMIKNGLIEEVKGLIEKGLTIENQAMQGIGYKEIYEYISGAIDKETAIENIKLNTRHYAKRQITFFKKLQGKIDLPPTDVKALAKRIVEEL